MHVTAILYYSSLGPVPPGGPLPLLPPPPPSLPFSSPPPPPPSCALNLLVQDLSQVALLCGEEIPRRKKREKKNGSFGSGSTIRTTSKTFVVYLSDMDTNQVSELPEPKASAGSGNLQKNIRVLEQVLS